MVKLTSNLLIVGLLLCLFISCVYSSQVVDSALDKSASKLETLPIDPTTKDQAAELHEFIVKPLVKSIANRIQKVAQQHPKETNQIKQDVQSLGQRLENRLRGQYQTLNQQNAKQVMQQKQEQAIANIRSNLGL